MLSWKKKLSFGKKLDFVKKIFFLKRKLFLKKKIFYLWRLKVSALKVQATKSPGAYSAAPKRPELPKSRRPIYPPLVSAQLRMVGYPSLLICVSS